MITNTANTFVLATSSLTDALYDSVRSRIVNGEIEPGEKLTEARLSSEYGVARPTAKACVERLTGAGLLVRTAHKTATVPILSRDDILDVFVGRSAIERRAVAILAEKGTTPAEALQAHHALEAAAERGVFPDQVNADIRFHRSLVADTGSVRLTRMHDLIMAEVELTMGQYQAHRSASATAIASEHAAILDAVAAGDADTAETAVAEHLEHARDRLLARFDSEED